MERKSEPFYGSDEYINLEMMQGWKAYFYGANGWIDTRRVWFWFGYEMAVAARNNSRLRGWTGDTITKGAV
jgi:hypothetical protein